MSPPTTRIHLQDIQFNAAIGNDAWGRPAKPTQPVTVSISVRLGLSRADHASDDLSRSLDYSKLASLVLTVAQSPADYYGRDTEIRYRDPISFHEAIYEKVHPLAAEHTALKQYDGIKRDMHIETTLPIGTLGAAAKATWGTRLGGYSPTTTKFTSTSRIFTLYIADIHATTMIGVKAHEKTDRQSVLISLRLHLDQKFLAKVKDIGSLAHDVVRDVVSIVQETQVETVEALIEKVWDVLSTKWKKPTMLKVLKPDAIGFVGGAGVELCMLDEVLDKSGIDELRNEMDPRW